MSSIEPLQILLQQRERERDKAQAAHLQALAHHRATLAQVEQLRGYRVDYERRWTAQFQSPFTMELLHCYQGFVERLSQAIEQQERLERQAGAQCAAAADALREHEMRVAAAHKLIDRRAEEARLAGERSDQKATDEMAAQSSRPRALAGWTPAGAQSAVH